MKRLNNAWPLMQTKALSLKYLVVAVASMMIVHVAQADVAHRKVGDLEIYKAAEGGNIVITMMLDTSGSMTANQVGKDACDTPAGNKPVYKTSYYEWSSTTPSYKRDYCLVGKIKYYDRLTLLKDALFALMDSDDLDSKKVKIGIGQYSSQSGSDNNVKTTSSGRASNADGTTGKILVPAAFLDATHRNEIKKEVAAAAGGDGTPTAHAYAEVGAYMLGTNTSGTGSGFSKSVTSSKSAGRDSNYISPLASTTTATCDGRGIYFLTDGEPNASTNPKNLMKNALGKNVSIPTDTLPSTGGMNYVGAFARALRDARQNPLGTNGEILTAVVGFGDVFDVDKEADAKKPEKDRVIRTLSYEDSKGKTQTADFYNCDKITNNNNAKNACNWGAKSHPDLPSSVGGFGEGGFYSAQSTEDIVNSVTTFVKDLDNTLPATPSGTIVVPDDPYRADSQLAVAYYPTVQPRVDANQAIWEGNMKKYKLNEGTLYGKNGAKLFKNIGSELNETTPDMWSDKDYTNTNDAVESGGFYARLHTPKDSVASVRALYVEDWNSTDNSDKKTVLRKFGVNASGKVTVDNNELTDASFNDTTTYNEATLRKLLNFLGFDKLPSTETVVKDMTLKTDNVSKDKEVKVVGATIHSTPAAVSYSATLDEAGKVTDKRDDYVLFGSSEGGLHLVNADDYSATGDGGKEKFVIIPREILRDSKASEALVKGATNSVIGAPNFGIDAPWLVTADYKYDFDNKKVAIDTAGKGVSAYGGMRMGGEAFYGVDLNNANAPKMKFSITPSTSGFSRMGQIWSKPTAAKIKDSTAENDKGIDVLVFGGGYDMCYEREGFQVGINNATELGDCSNQSETKGNAVYIINAKTGKLIWSASSDSSATTKVDDMKHSVVAGITTLDRNNDGFMDHLYFADLSGQVFRADFTNAGFVKPVASGTSSPENKFSNTRVTKILNSTYTGDNSKYNHRFYERPVVSFYRNPVSNSLFALVNIISGDRSSPLSTLRDTTTKSDRLYGIMDTDVSKADSIFYASDFTSGSNTNGQKVTNLKDSDLAALPTAIGAASSSGYTLNQKNVVINDLKAGGKKGWYYPLNTFDGYGNVRYSKGIGKSEVIDSFLYTTVYNPDMSYGAVDSCTAEVVGGSERQLYCLPYGICTDTASKNGTAGYNRAGKGIQELTLGPRSSTLTNQRLLIGTQTLTERANGRTDFGNDSGKGIYDGKEGSQGLDQQSLIDTDRIPGSGTAPLLIHNDRFTLQPKKWYEVD